MFVESAPVFQALFEAEFCQSTGLLLATGSGLPRAPMRRVLHRIQQRFALPIYVLTDNDTWGYFLVSMLCRGALAPNGNVPQLAVEEPRYVGLRATSAYAAQNKQLFGRDWKPHWSTRLECLRMYDCFRSAAWQAELNAFEEQKCAVNLQTVLEGLGAPHLMEIVDSAIKARDWLDTKPASQ